MTSETHSSRGSRRAVLLWTLVVGVLTTLVAVYALRGSPTLQPAQPETPAVTVGEPVIVLPHDPPDLPPGPNREQFMTACTICHSTRLITNQPPFPRTKWAEVVDKMVAAYGAPITPDEKPLLVEYLMTLRGTGE